MPETLTLYLYGFVLFIAGLILGYLLNRKAQSKLLGSKSKLNNEVLIDQVKLIVLN